MTRTQDRPPALCPGCGKRSHSAATRPLCEECGTRLVDRGYCPVCEAYANAAVGEPCPKHDVPLEAGPQAVSPRPDVQGPWVEIARFHDAMGCQPPRIRLEAEGIPTSVDGERGGSQSMHPAFSGGVVLRVPQSLAAEARVILDQKWSADVAALEMDDVDWDEVDEDFHTPPETGPGLRRSSPFFYTIAMIAAWGVVVWVAIAALRLALMALGT